MSEENAHNMERRRPRRHTGPQPATAAQAETKTPARAPALHNETPRHQAENALKQANRAAKNGDLAQAERWSKTAERLAATAERLAALPPPVDERQDEEERRAELRRRLAKFVEEAQEIERWEAERETYEAQVFAALANNLDPPEPLRPHPLGAQAGEDAYDIAIARCNEGLDVHD